MIKLDEMRETKITPYSELYYFTEEKYIKENKEAFDEA